MHDLGVVLCVAGLGFSVWARRHLGRNWGVPMSLKEGHELVTTGPYALVRHPIYTGILFALFGTVLAGGMLALLFFVFFCPYFLYAMWTEDRLMTGQFPGEYAEYKRRTKLVIPWVW